jgi:type II secretory pathway component PulF
MRAGLLFALAIGIYVAYRFYESYNDGLDEDILTSLKGLSASIQEGKSIESSLKELSKGTDRASHLYRKVLERMQSGMSLSEAFTAVQRRYTSSIVTCMAKLMTVAERSKRSAAAELDEFATRMRKMREIKKKLYATTGEHIMVLQVIVIILMPLSALFLPPLLGVEVYPPLHYFMVFIVLAFGSLDYLVYNDLKKTIFILPVFITAYVLVVTRLAPYVSGLFQSVWT